MMVRKRSQTDGGVIDTDKIEKLHVVHLCWHIQNVLSYLVGFDEHDNVLESWLVLRPEIVKLISTPISLIVC